MTAWNGHASLDSELLIFVTNDALLVVFGTYDGVALHVDVLQVGDAVLQSYLHLQRLVLVGHIRDVLSR